MSCVHSVNLVSNNVTLQVIIHFYVIVNKYIFMASLKTGWIKKIYQKTIAMCDFKFELSLDRKINSFIFFLQGYISNKILFQSKINTDV